MAISIPETVVPITRPPEGETVSVTTEAQRVYHLTFEPVDVLFDVEQNNLVIIFNDRTRVVLRDFCRVAESGTVFFELPDGIVLDALEVYRNLTIEDFETHMPLPEGSTCLSGTDAPHNALPMPEESSAPLSLNDVLTASEPSLFGSASGGGSTRPLTPAARESSAHAAAPCGMASATDADAEAEALMRFFSII